jgi:GTP 3',8-cyclase
MLVDPYGRRIDYVRLSITDRCNFRCVYCMPAQGMAFCPTEEVLTDDEIVRLAEVLASLGVRRLRVTGGEPLVRPGVVDLVGRLSGIPGIEDLSLSTNGSRLAGLAQDLRRAGIRRVNVSLDTLRQDRFAAVSRAGHIRDVWEGIDAALRAGFDPVKLNVVVMRGINEDEIPSFVELARRRPLHVRFIELMPIGGTGFFGRHRWAPYEDILRKCGPLEPVPLDDLPMGAGPAHTMRPASGSRGTVGFIGAMGCNFCKKCNRVRLTSRGVLHPCLGWEDGVDLRTPLRSGASSEALARLVRLAVAQKPEGHAMTPDGGPVRETFMCGLGG